MRRFWIVGLMTGIGCVFGTAAYGDSIVTTGTDNKGTSNVLFNDPAAGTVTNGFNYVIGKVNDPVGGLVKFQSNEKLFVNNFTGGQAKIESVDVNSSNGGFKVMSIFFTKPANYLITKIDLNIDSTANGQVKFYEGLDSTWLFTSNTLSTNGIQTLSKNGQNKFVVNSKHGISALSFIVPGGVKVEVADLEQVRVGGIPTPTSVPVPSAIWGGLGLFGVLGACRVMRTRRTVLD